MTYSIWPISFFGITYTCLHIDTYTYVYIHIFIHMYMYMYVYVLIRTGVYDHTHIYICICMYAYLFISSRNDRRKAFVQGFCAHTQTCLLSLLLSHVFSLILSVFSLSLSFTHTLSLFSSYTRILFRHFIPRAKIWRLATVLTCCNTLQHTATHCNTLQHAATHSKMLQHTEQNAT